MKYLVLALIILLISSCESKNEPFIGYIVAKEYIQGHMCHDDNFKHVVEAGFVHVPHVPHVHHHKHKWQRSQFIIYVANRYEVKPFHIDSLLYNIHNVTDKVTIK